MIRIEELAVVGTSILFTAAVVLAGVRIAADPPRPTSAIVAEHRYTVGQLTAPGGPTGMVYCAIVITDTGAVTTLFCEPTDTAESIPASPPRLPYATPQSQ